MSIRVNIYRILIRKNKKVLFSWVQQHFVFILTDDFNPEISPDMLQLFNLRLFSRVNPATGDLHVSLHWTNICFKAVKFAPQCICCPSHSEPDKRGTVLNIKSHLQTQYLLQHKTLTASISSSWPQDGVKTKCLDLQQVHVFFFFFSSGIHFYVFTLVTWFMWKENITGANLPTFLTHLVKLILKFNFKLVFFLEAVENITRF